MTFIKEHNQIFAENDEGERLAEIAFLVSEGGTVSIDHTFVDASLRGRGIAAVLMQMTVRELRQSGREAKPVCSYAQKWFSEHPEEADLLADS